MGPRSHHTAQEGGKNANQSQNRSKGPCEDARGNRYKSIYIHSRTSPKRGGLGCLQAEEHHPNREAWGGSIMLWGCFAAVGTGALHKLDGITRMENCVDILKQHLKTSVKVWAQISLPNGKMTPSILPKLWQNGLRKTKSRYWSGHHKFHL